jgi:hypothetical protein
VVDKFLNTEYELNPFTHSGASDSHFYTDYRQTQHSKRHIFLFRRAVSADLGCMQRLSCVSNAGSVSRACMTPLKVVLLLNLIMEAEARASTCRLSGMGVWLGRELDVGHARIHVQLLELDPVFSNGSG